MNLFRHLFRYGPHVGAALGAASVVTIVSKSLHKQADCSYNPTHPSSKRYSASEAYPDLSKHENIMAKTLTPRLYAMLRDRQTEIGITLDQCIQVGVDNPGHPLIRTVGIFAGDEESYSVFAELFDPIIQERHSGYKPSDKHTTDLSPAKLRGGNLDPDYVLSCRIRTCRNIRGFSLPPTCTRAERRHIEKIVVRSCKSLGGNLKGRYFNLKDIPDEELALMIAEGTGFDRPSSYYCTSSIGRDWPDARGIFYNYDKNLFVFVNECEDQMKLIAVQPGGNMKETFERFCQALESMEKNLHSDGFAWMWNDHLGFVTTCPSNLGTALRASVFIKLPRLSQDPRFPAIVKKLGLHKRAVPELQNSGVYDMSNVDRLGISEVDSIQQVIDSSNLLIRMEKRLKSDRTIDHLIPS
ncbi:creatine kinase B-type-like [Paramacrobiotus metropolitanus]|uniref:creatine kinase B-type-like n=1 Tax=Paramacrobiotus metropolitanus TaxID=2943436 RepID=UPI0024460E3A|nr:creatine kinase B-type-like [Paramacrobiotus metropolitanus]